MVLALLCITALYVVAAELLERWFYRREDARQAELSPKAADRASRSVEPGQSGLAWS